MSKNLAMTPQQVRDIIAKAEKWDAAEAELAERSARGGGRRGALSDLVGNAVRREFYPGGGGGAQVTGPLGELTPSQRAFAAHVATSMERDTLFQKNVLKGVAFAPASSVRASLQASGVRFNTGETAGAGAELVEVCPTTEIWKGAMCRSDLWEQLNPRPIKGKMQKVVNLTGVPTAYVTPPAEDCTELDCRTVSTVGTRTHEHPAAKISIDLCMPVELTEDSFFEVVDEYTQIAEEQIRFATEEAIIRGDATLAGTTNINSVDVAITLTAAGQAPSYTAFDGIAHATIVDNTANAAGATIHTAGDPISTEAIMKARALMNDTAVHRHWGFCDPTQLLIITDPQTYASLVSNEDVKWFDRVGPDATIITGKLPFIWGIPIYMSTALVPVNITGSYDADTAGNNLYGQLHIVNREALRVGVHRELEVLTEVNKKCDLVTITLQWRLSLARRASASTAAGIEGIASIYGIAA